MEWKAELAVLTPRKGWSAEGSRCDGDELKNTAALLSLSGPSRTGSSHTDPGWALPGRTKDSSPKTAVPRPLWRDTERAQAKVSNSHFAKYF